MNSFPVKEIKPDCFFSEDTYLELQSEGGLYDDDTGGTSRGAFIITAPEMPFTKDIINILDRWNFKAIYSDGEAGGEYSGSDSLSSLSPQSDGDKLEKAEEVYNGFLEYTQELLERLIKGEADYNNISDKIKDITGFIKENSRFLMRILRNIEPGEGKNYLAFHSARTAILSIVIGSFMKMPPYKQIELGIAALLHEAGMLRLPSQIYMSGKTLTDQEQKAIIAHPALGYNMLKLFDFPLAVCLAALEHHERENGSGYPRKVESNKISMYSKIIAVACSYEALSTKRPYREAKDGYTGMLELLKNEGGQYDDTVIKALVHSLSIYPIGLNVLLSNGKKGQVVDVNPENPRFPVVQIFREYTPEGKLKLIQTSSGAVSISRSLDRSEAEN